MHFNTRNMSDGTKLKARLRITGSSQSVPATSAEVKISVSVVATPSLVFSKFEMPTQVNKGEELRISTVNHTVYYRLTVLLIVMF